jgi:hypothetical protein
MFFATFYEISEAASSWRSTKSLRFVARQRREFPRLAAGAVNEGQGGGVDQAYDGWRVVSQFEFQQWVDTVEKLDFLPRSQFLRQQAGFKKKALRVSAERLTFRCAAAVANWRWQCVALSALHEQTPIF